MLSQFKLPYENEEYSAYCGIGLSQNIVKPLSQINYFIGPNNSGKSRLLRLLLKDILNYKVPQKPENISHIKIDANKKLALFEISFEAISEKVQKFTILFDKCIKNTDNQNALAAIFDKPEKSSFDEFELIDFYNVINSKFTNIYSTEFDKTEVARNSLEKKRQDYVHGVFSSILSEVISFTPRLADHHVTYVPSLRTLRRFLVEAPEMGGKKPSYSFSESQNYELIEQDIFKSRVMFDYFLNDQNFSNQVSLNGKSYSHTIDPNRIFTGETLFNEIKRLRNSGEKDRRILTDFEHFLSFSFFESKTVSLNALDINNVKDVYIKIGVETEFPIYHLGDGIQAVILLTFPLFINRTQQHLIFYEEPELFLHPGMQRIFVDALVKFDKTQAYIATHSNHLLETSLDYPNRISIFSLKKNLGYEAMARFEIETLSSPKLSILNELGVRNSSVLLANCSIWVEGVSDRLYLRKFLEVYQKQNSEQSDGILNFKEDLHYSFFEYGGNNIVHYNFQEDGVPGNISAHKITNRIFLIHDRDQGNKKRHDNLRQQLNQHYFELPVLEIENLLLPEVLHNTLYSFKENDEIVIPELIHEEYKMTPIAVFVNKKIPNNLKQIFTQPKGKQTSKLYNKATFAQAAIVHIKEWKDLSSDAQELTKKIFEFIKKNNFTQ